MIPWKGRHEANDRRGLAGCRGRDLAGGRSFRGDGQLSGLFYEGDLELNGAAIGADECFG